MDRFGRLLLLSMLLLVFLWVPLQMSTHSIQKILHFTHTPSVSHEHGRAEDQDTVLKLKKDAWNIFSPYLCGTFDPLKMKALFLYFLIPLWCFVTAVSQWLQKKRMRYHPVIALIFIGALYLFFQNHILVFIRKQAPFHAVYSSLISVLIYLAFFYCVFAFRCISRKIVVFILMCSLVIGSLALFQYQQISFGFLDISGDFRRNLSSTLGHNTATAFFMLQTMVLAVMYFRRKYLVLIPCICLQLVVIVLSQSRSAWLLLVVDVIIVSAMYPGIIRQSFKKCKTSIQWRWGISIFAMVFALLIFSQSFPNRFMLSSKTVWRRLYDFSPQVLIRGTRLRINRIGLDMIAKHPIAGVGIGTFSYYYPHAQGEYFYKHPDGLLQPSNKNTNRAHNDWLQFAIENGLPLTLGIFLGALFCLHLLWKRKRYFYFILLINICLHSLWDFPWHLPFFSLFMLFLLAMILKVCLSDLREIKGSVLVGAASVAIFILSIVSGYSLYFNQFFLAHAQRYLRAMKTPAYRQWKPEYKKLWLSKALFHLKKAAKYAPYDQDTNYYLGSACLANKDYVSAGKYLQQARIYGSSHYLDYRFAQAQYFLRDYDQSDQALKMCLFKAPTFMMAYNLRLKTILKTNKVDKHFFQLFKKYKEPTEYNDLYYRLGRFLDRKSFTEYAVLLENCVNAYPEDNVFALFSVITFSQFKKDVPAKLINRLNPGNKSIFLNYPSIHPQSYSFADNSERAFYFFLMHDDEKLKEIADRGNYLAELILALKKSVQDR